MAASLATPAQAREGIDAGTVIAGALVVGGIAALAASSGNERDDSYYDRGHRSRYDGYRGGYRGVSSREAVDRCVSAATGTANRYGGRARVTQVRDVDRKDYGYKVEGRIAVENYARGRWSRRGDVDTGKFTCRVNYGGALRNLEFSGIRGL
ncbi:hypothetical protein HT136_00745 [Novosphingobium profundi]|nr:hypothetical protein [Novosphingobium profundi]